MSLPLGGTWPPSPHHISLSQMAVWDAWLVGDPAGLVAAYSSAASGNRPGYINGNNGEQRSTGILPTIGRLFWARPSVSGSRKARLHVPLAADIATASADLLFSEPPQFVASEDTSNEAARVRIDDILNEGSFHSMLVEAAETVAALGGGWLRLVWDQTVADRVMVDAVSADSAIGEWRWGQLVAVTFFTEFGERNDREVVRHLERHEPGAIFHGLYQGDDTHLGRQIALADHPDTAPYFDLVDEQSAIATGIGRLTAAYVANIRPQRKWRKIEGLQQLGRSDYDGCEALMDALDECYTSWMRDVRLAKARLIVPETMLTNLNKGQGAAFDEDKEIYTALNIMQQATGPATITPQQFAIRVKEHQETAAQLTDEILRAAGYSPSTFGLGSDGQMATATEVVSRERQSDRTREKKARYWSASLESLLDTWLELDAIIFKTGAKGEVEVQWSEDSQEDSEKLARTADYLKKASAASTRTLVAMQHSDWDESQIDEEVALIIGEQPKEPVNLPPEAPKAPKTKTVTNFVKDKNGAIVGKEEQQVEVS